MSRTLEQKEYQRLWAENNRKKNPEKRTAIAEARRLNRKLNGDLHYQQNKDIYIQKASEYYQRNKEQILQKSRERHLQKTYNLTSADYYNMVQEQKCVCAICNKPETRLLKTGDVKPLSVDHNHVTGEVRKLLCNDCNALLGFAHEDLTILENAIKYLEYFGVERRGY